GGDAFPDWPGHRLQPPDLPCLVEDVVGQELDRDRIPRKQRLEREPRPRLCGVEVHVDLGEHVAALLDIRHDPRALAHSVMRPGEEPAHPVAAFEGAAAAFHRAVLGEPALDQCIVVTGQEISDISFVVESHSSSRITASAASVCPTSARMSFTTPALALRRMFSIFMASTVAR